MPVGWLGNFTRGTSGLSLDIVRGLARRGAQRHWTAHFEIRSTLALELERTDFLSLAREPSAHRPELTLALDSFELTRSSERKGALELRLRAPDRTGFLAALLEHLAGFVLFPEEISINTYKLEAQDTLLLSSVAGQSPPPELEGALRASLRACTRDRFSLPPST
jgi:UTP:GlnB (protein PII) uridylyltransferase